MEIYRRLRKGEFNDSRLVEESEIVKMQGLRVYINPADTNGEHAVFYSRRDDGPYYRWRYEVELSQWCCTRLHLGDFAPNALCLARWKAVPVELQRSLGKHYLE